jgi:serine/threonine protein kinase KIN1/2
MTTAISPGAEAAHSSPPRGQAYNGVARSQSTRSRAPAANTGALPSRAASQHLSTHNHSNSAGGRPVQDVLPHRDYETTNVAAHHKRTPSKDTHQDSRGPQRRSSQRSSHHASHGVPGQPPAEMTTANNAGPAAVAHGGAADARGAAAKQLRARTTIPTQSGKWILGKTIGQGSMGKVKLARKEDSNEQVSLPSLHLFGLPIVSLTSLFSGCLQDHPKRLRRRRPPFSSR